MKWDRINEVLLLFIRCSDELSIKHQYNEGGQCY